MTGKEKCEFLKEIRVRMAELNGIPYEPRECHHEGDCLGTCPLCEVESQYILEELKKKASEGMVNKASSRSGGQDAKERPTALRFLFKISLAKVDVASSASDIGIQSSPGNAQT